MPVVRRLDESASTTTSVGLEHRRRSGTHATSGFVPQDSETAKSCKNTFTFVKVIQGSFFLDTVYGNSWNG